MRRYASLSFATPDPHIPIFILLYRQQLQQRQQIEMVD